MKTKLFLILIIVFGYVVRFYNLNNLPSILNRDEAALAYNAYLLKETGQDEWGKTWPLALESFGDYKLLGYPLYLTLSFSVFGENDFAARLPSALAGIILIIISYFFAKNTFFKKQKYLAVIFSFIIALTPVFIFYSRMAFEANVALFLLVLALLLILKNNKFLDFIAIIIYLLAIFTYNTPFILLPIIILLIPLLRGIKKYKSWSFITLGLSLVFIFGVIKLLPLTMQKSGITIFSDELVWTESVKYRNSFTGIWQTLLGSKYIFWSKIALSNFFKSFSYSFLSLKGGNHPWHSLPGFGHLFASIYILFYIGLVPLFNKVFAKNKSAIFIFLLLLSSLIPSIITVDSPHATRSLLFFYLFSLISILGLKFVLKFKKIKKFIFIIFLLIISFESINYLNNYFAKYPNNQLMLKPGFDQVINQVTSSYQDQEIAIVADSYQYILLAWYLKLPPEDFYSTIIKQQPDRIGFRYGQQLMNYHFIANENDRVEQEKILIFWDNTQWLVKEY